MLRTAADLDLDGNDASDADIQAYIKLQALPVLKGYVKNYGDRKGRVVLQAKGYAAVPASDAVIGMTPPLDVPSAHVLSACAPGLTLSRGGAFQIHFRY